MPNQCQIPSHAFPGRSLRAYLHVACETNVLGFFIVPEIDIRTSQAQSISIYICFEISLRNPLLAVIENMIVAHNRSECNLTPMSAAT